jgi:hypothetical protein
MALEIVKTEEMGLPKLNVLVYGHPGVGKTTFAAISKDVLLADVEGGANFLSLRGIKVDTVRIQKWADLEDLYKMVKEGKWKTVAIDPIGELLDKLIEELKATGYCDSKGASMTIQGWGVAKDKFKKMIRRFRDLDVNLILVAHSAEKKTEESLIVRPKLQASLEEDVCAMMNLVGYLKVEKGSDKKLKRRLLCQPTDCYYAKDRTGTLPESIEDPTFDKVQEIVHTNPHFLKSAQHEQKMNDFEKELDAN